MDFIRKNVFWIGLAVLVLAGVGLWAAVVPAIASTADEYKSKCKEKVGDFERLAKRAESKDDSAPDSIKNPKHVQLASEYGKKVKEQLDALRKDLGKRKLELKFDVSGITPSDYDTKLKEIRDNICKQAEQAGLVIPPDERKRLMFEGSTTDDKSDRPELHWNYRLRQMAIVDEIVSILCKKPVKQPVWRFEPKKEAAEAQDTVDAGALALERLTILPPAAPGASRGPAASGELRAGAATADDRQRLWVEEAWKRSGREVKIAKTGKFQELPYSITSIDVQFLAPLIALPAIVQALETSDRYSAVVTRVECLRAVRPYPDEKDARLAKAEPVPGLNTRYQEGPVRAVVSLDLYEYDDAKAKAAEAAAKAPPPAEKDATKKGAEPKK
ncbi:MAG: Amuc_1100 family pilus-like protein [Planctomycetota bacterium]|nr:Amuc_1100 family pilus-like protein [Planctomycetota bacterium]